MRNRQQESVALSAGSSLQHSVKVKIYDKNGLHLQIEISQLCIFLHLKTELISLSFGNFHSACSLPDLISYGDDRQKDKDRNIMTKTSTSGHPGLQSGCPRQTDRNFAFSILKFTSRSEQITFCITRPKAKELKTNMFQI